MLLRNALFLTGILASAGSGAQAQGRLEEETAAASVRVVLEGSVFDEDGNVATGAVVVSSAGGRAVVDEGGRYRLAVDVLAGVERVQIVAVGGDTGNQVGQADLAVAGQGGRTQAGALRLATARCAPRWMATFGSLPGLGGLPGGFPATVRALAVYDDGSGSALYVGGSFHRAGSLEESYLARWDGSQWSEVGNGTNEVVTSLAVFDDGGGAALYVGGHFTRAGGPPAAGGVAAAGAARWDGSSWAAVDTGLAFSSMFLGVLDDGSGPALYATNYPKVVRFDGSTWTPLGGDFDEVVRAVEVFDDGTGPALYAGGDFTSVGGVAVNHLARWDGTSWSDAGPAGTFFFDVDALRAFDDGSGLALYAGGSFASIPLGSSNVARWDGALWSFPDSGTKDPVRALTIHDDGTGAALYTGSARWDGASWTSLDIDGVLCMAAFDDGQGTALFAGGAQSGSDVGLHSLGRWDGSRWTPVGQGLDSFVDALAVHDDGSGAALYAGGSFRTPAEGEAKYLARWDGASWQPLGSGLDGTVLAMATFDDGSGAALYAGGAFGSAGGAPASNVARWDGTSWSPLGSGLNDLVRALAVWDDGTGPALYAGGDFTSAGGAAANRIAKWDGASWSPLAGGLAGTSAPRVHALRVHDDGSGRSLFAGGEFSSAGTAAAVNIARWNGTRWFKLGTLANGNGIASAVQSLEVFDDGSGAALFVGTSSGLSRWNGSWTTVTGGAGLWVQVLRVFDDGSGAALHVGGSFTSIAGVAANHVARWDGASWSPLGSGVSSEVRALARFRGTLFVGGTFETSGADDSYLARWGCAPLRVR